MAFADDLFQQAVTAHQTGDLDAAEHGYRQLLSHVPDHVSGLTNLASIIARRGDTQEAEALYLQAITAAPAHADAHFNLGNLYRRLGRVRDAASRYEEVLRITPNSPAALVNLGLAVGHSGEWPRAVDCFARAATIAPHLPDPLHYLADALARCGRRAEAVAALRESVSRFPDAPRGYQNLGIQLAASGETEDAVTAFERALALNPDYAEAHNALGVVQETVGRTDDAQAGYRQAIRLRPDFADAWMNLGTSLGEQGHAAEAIEALRRALTLAPNPLAGSALLLNLMCSAHLTAEQLKAEHVAWADAYANPLVPATVPPKRPPGAKGRTRVGYVMGDFRSRPAVAFLEALLTHHDRTRFHITVYASPVKPDEQLDALRRLADTWKPVAHLTDDRLAGTVRADEIDILVDLNGHGPGNRLLAFARKPAATQISLFGYPATTGLRTMDYRVTDAVTDPPGSAEELYVEKLLRLPDLGWLYVPPKAPEPNPLPAARNREFRFGCLNHPGKVSDASVETWAAILNAVPNARLVLLAGQSVTSAGALAERFTRHGVASDQIELINRLTATDYIGTYHRFDMALDPFPFGGAVTACDALWMGVPVLTAACRDARGRQGLAVLNALGLPEFVADSPDQLVTLAATWADQRDSLADLRATLREMMMQSPVTAAASYVKQLEAAYMSV
ncbi:tetratricopeptide repeat protein [Frigoriglobus tundricola]|uniref:protein O-GlcNAc transferase n=1 Tax=Frigoriglobus tundricola TaxID=2774151 RepID=A0A6M5Z1P2_9BACT|nr:tetratricopeptide repeat protein [Frigoriglobus tundricola]QJW99734.1 GT41 family glycosyltransferase [Frigoriglobus tundricola]